jgi:hypothetical protein
MPTVDIGPLNVSGQITANVFDPGNAPTNVIRNNQTWSVRCEWFLDGPLAQALGGQWTIQLLAEGQSNTLEFTDASPDFRNYVQLDGRSGPGNPYRARFDFPAGSLNMQGRPQQVLDLTVALTHVDLANTPGPIAGFVELGKVMVYEAD